MEQNYNKPKSIVEFKKSLNNDITPKIHEALGHFESEIHQQAEQLNYAKSSLDNIKKSGEQALSQMFTELLKNEKVIQRKTTNFTIQNLKDLENVENAKFVNGEVHIITKENTNFYINRGNSSKTKLKHTMPSYTLIYFLESRIDALDDELFVDKHNKPKFDIKKLKLRISITDKKLGEEIFKPEKLLEMPQDQLPEALRYPYINPYIQHNLIESSTGEIFGQNICFGSDSSTQNDLLNNGQLFFHAINTIKTLYTPDPEGEGHTSWLNMIKSKYCFDLLFKLKAYKNCSLDITRFGFTREKELSVDKKVLFTNTEVTLTKSCLNDIQKNENDAKLGKVFLEKLNFANNKLNNIIINIEVKDDDERELVVYEVDAEDLTTITTDKKKRKITTLINLITK